MQGPLGKKLKTVNKYVVISMTKSRNPKLNRVKSNVKYTESKLAKERPRYKEEEILKNPLSYRYHAEKGIALKGQHANRHHANKYQANRHNAKRQHSKGRNAKCQKVTLKKTKNKATSR